uniref:CPCFC domain-containing protein n=1 Tax=Rhodnius prolixus TaxID=13249 RepID=T1H8U8_RHOPR
MSGHIFIYMYRQTPPPDIDTGWPTSDMISNTILTALAYCVGISLAAQFPAGIDPRLCPNYPQCDNAILAAFSKNPLPFMTQGKQK